MRHVKITSDMLVSTPFGYELTKEGAEKIAKNLKLNVSYQLLELKDDFIVVKVILTKKYKKTERVVEALGMSTTQDIIKVNGDSVTSYMLSLAQTRALKRGVELFYPQLNQEIVKLIEKDIEQAKSKLLQYLPVIKEINDYKFMKIYLRKVAAGLSIYPVNQLTLSELVEKIIEKYEMMKETMHQEQ